MLILITVTVIVHTSDTLVPLILFEPYYFCDIEYKKAKKICKGVGVHSCSHTLHLEKIEVNSGILR